MYNDYYNKQEMSTESWNMELDNEETCFSQYDCDMANAAAEADYQDYYEEQSYDYQSDSLLELVVGVQSYLAEQQANSTKCDSPLYNLQYKLYTYMRQRALELGVEF